MSRFHLQPLRPATTQHRPVHVEQSLLQFSHSRSVQYSLFVPLHYERNYAYPLVIWLHGPGDDERQLQRVMPLISMRNYAGIGPRGPRRPESGAAGYVWSQSDRDVDAAECSVFECLEAVLEKLNIALHRVFLAGYQCGGTMAFRLGLRHPERFAGVLSLGGPFPIGDSPLLYLDQARRLPLFIAQGRESEFYPIEKTCQELRLYHAAGMHVTLRQYPCGDELNTQMLHDMDVWLMEQVTGTSSSDAENVSPYLGNEN